MPNNEVKQFLYPELSADQIIDRRRELCSELEEITAQLAGQLIESAWTCAELRAENERLKWLLYQKREV